MALLSCLFDNGTSIVWLHSPASRPNDGMSTTSCDKARKAIESKTDKLVKQFINMTACGIMSRHSDERPHKHNVWELSWVSYISQLFGKMLVISMAVCTKINSTRKAYVPVVVLASLSAVSCLRARGLESIPTALTAALAYKFVA